MDVVVGISIKITTKEEEETRQGLSFRDVVPLPSSLVFAVLITLFPHHLQLTASLGVLRTVLLENETSFWLPTTTI